MNNMDTMLMPLIQNQYRVLFDNQATHNILTLQMISVDMDWLRKTVILKISHPIDNNKFIYAISNILRCRNFPLYFFDGSDHPLFCLTGCTVVGHSFRLNYAKGEEAAHMISLNYDTVLDSDNFFSVK